MDTALGKGLRALEALANADGPVRLSHLAAQLELQKSSMHRVLGGLVAAGFAHQDASTGLYSATLKVWELGSRVIRNLPVKQAATSVLQELHRDTGETVSLTIRDGDDVVYLDKIISPRPLGFTTHVGSRVPAPMTVSGKAMLAYEADARATIERVAAVVGPDALDVERALADVSRARDDGYLIGRGRRGRGVVGIGAAVPGANDRAVAGLTVSAPSQRLTRKAEQAIVEALLAAAARLGEAIGRA